jgi:hypothetical protein
MNAPDILARDSIYLADTHQVTNVSRELVDYNMFAQDAALVDAVQREGAAWAQDSLSTFGALTGSADCTWTWAYRPTAIRRSWTHTTASATASIWSAFTRRITR